MAPTTEANDEGTILSPRVGHSHLFTLLLLPGELEPLDIQLFDAIDMQSY